MKATLEFNLPEEESDFLTAAQAGKLHCVITEMDQFLRKKMKYEDIETLKTEDVRKELWEIIRGYGIEDLFG